MSAPIIRNIDVFGPRGGTRVYNCCMWSLVNKCRAMDALRFVQERESEILILGDALSRQLKLKSGVQLAASSGGSKWNPVVTNSI